MLVSAPGIFIAESIWEGSDRTTCLIPFSQAPWLYHSHMAAFHIAGQDFDCLFKLVWMGQHAEWVGEALVPHEYSSYYGLANG